MINAYDLRNGEYRYLRGDSSYVEKIETRYGNSVLVSSGMSAISLVFQYLASLSDKKLKVWYPYDLYEGTYELISLLGFVYDDVSPDVVIYDYPSFAGNYHKSFFKNAKVIVDNSLNPLERPDCDYLVTSFSKYHTNCETVLGIIRCKAKDDVDILKRLRWKSGYVVMPEQADVFMRNRGNLTDRQFKDILLKQFEVCNLISIKLKEFEIENMVVGGCLFIMVPDECSEKEMAFLTSFLLCPTYGYDKTLCCYSYCDDNYRYFGNDKRIGKWLRVSPGLDHSVEFIVSDIVRAYYSCKRNF